jgi:hypothetical protein
MTKNIRHFELSCSEQDTVRMLSARLVVTLHLARNLALAHLLHSCQGSSSGLWTLLSTGGMSTYKLCSWCYIPLRNCKRPSAKRDVLYKFQWLFRSPKITRTLHPAAFSHVKLVFVVRFVWLQHLVAHI